MECPRCLGQRLEEEAREEERRRREEERSRPRKCGLEDCAELFVAQTAWQKYCSGECRWKAHRRLKAGLAG